MVSAVRLSIVVLVVGLLTCALWLGALALSPKTAARSNLADAFRTLLLDPDESIGNGPAVIWRLTRDCEAAHLAANQEDRGLRYLFAPRLTRDTADLATACEMARDRAVGDTVVEYRESYAQANPIGLRAALLGMLSFDGLGLWRFLCPVLCLAAASVVAALADKRALVGLFSAIALVCAAAIAGSRSLSIGPGALLIPAAAIAMVLWRRRGRKATFLAGLAAMSGASAVAFSYDSGLALSVFLAICLLLGASEPEATGGEQLTATCAYFAGVFFMLAAWGLGSSLAIGADPTLRAIGRSTSDLPALLGPDRARSLTMLKDHLADLTADGWGAVLLPMFFVPYVWGFSLWAGWRAGRRDFAGAVAFGAMVLWVLTNPVKLFRNPQDYVLPAAIVVLFAIVSAVRAFGGRTPNIGAHTPADARLTTAVSASPSEV